MSIVTFGEIMLRLSTNGYLRFTQSDHYYATYGGGEANVAVSLAHFGHKVHFVSKLPKHEIGEHAIQSLRKYNVNTDFITRGGERVGIYYLEKGASQRPSKVIYDRKYSSISMANKADFDWDMIFKDCTWFHFTGITPALGSEIAEICLEACKKAKEKGITISCDLNYRKKLWTKQQANETMSKLMHYVDVCIANEEDAADVFNIHAANTDIHSGKLDYSSYIDVARQLTDRFNFKYVAITLRKSINANINEWAAMLFENNQAFFSKEYTLHIVDRVGGGDSFGAGLIHSLIQNKSNQDSIEFAVASSCLKHSIEGDFNLVSEEEVLQLVNGNGSGRVQR